MPVLDRISPLPLYYQLANELREEVRTFVPGSRFLTEQEIREKYKVSRFTIGKAIGELVHEKILYRIQGSGTFVAEAEPVVAPCSSHTGNVLVFLPREFRRIVLDGDYVFADMIQGVLDGLQITANPILVTIPRQEDETTFIQSRIRNYGIDGVILLPWQNISNLVKVLKHERKPFVLLNVKQQAFRGMNRVLAREAHGIAKAVRHLVKLGYDRFLYLYTADDESMRNVPEQDRKAAFFQSLEQYNIAASNQHAFFWMDRGQELLRLFDGADAPTAIVAENDVTAIRAMRILQNAGMRVPEDISITGFDDSPVSSQSSPPLTTVQKPRHKMGMVAAGIVVEQIEKGFSLKGDTLLDTELTVRRSCAEVRSSQYVYSPILNG